MTEARRPSERGRVAWATSAWMATLHAGALLALVPANFTWGALISCALLYWMTLGLGICLTYHRLLTHRSFGLRPRWLEYPLAAIACCASQGGPVAWVADHRRHHAHSDDENDVHSPTRGFSWSHFLWFITPDGTCGDGRYLSRWAPDLARDPVHFWLDRWHALLPLLVGAGLYVFGGMPYLVWGGFVRSVLVLHSTWFVNSATHIWGYRTHATNDRSTNLWWVALLAFGEGWHNNHHAHQRSARHGRLWWEIDATYCTIYALSLLGIAHSIKLPTREAGNAFQPHWRSSQPATIRSHNHSLG
jgi:fatty-acid desaturase